MDANLQLLGEFDNLLDRAEKAAAQFDGATHVAVLADLDTLSTRMLQASWEPSTLSHLRTRLVRYRNLCQFLGAVLNTALRGASTADDSRYEDHGHLVDHQARALVERYG